MIYRTLITLFLLISVISEASDSLVFRTGVDMTRYKSGSLFSLGIQNKINEYFVYKTDLGFWADSDSSRKTSPFVGLTLGPKLGDYAGFNFNCQAGIMVIGYPDSVLSTPFQFTEECAVGYKEVSLGYKHISNAGIKEPNYGRDYIFIQYTSPFTF